MVGILTVTGGCCCLKYILAVKGTGGIGVGGRNRWIEGDRGCGRGQGAERRAKRGLRDKSGRKWSSRDRGAGLATSPAA